MKTYTLDGERIDIEDFITTNTHPDVAPLHPDEIAAIRALKPGEAWTTGGGAAAEFVLACEHDLKSLADEAQDEFWAKVVELLPECKTGDFPPECDIPFSQACRKAVEEWHMWNKPE